MVAGPTIRRLCVEPGYSEIRDAVSELGARLLARPPGLCEILPLCELCLPMEGKTHTPSLLTVDLQRRLRAS